MGLGLAVTWLATALVFRFSSLAALVAAASAPAWAWWTTQDPEYIALAIGLAGVLIWRHRANIRRLINGEESRIGKNLNPSQIQSAGDPLTASAAERKSRAPVAGQR